jgi:uncharacterized protein
MNISPTNISDRIVSIDVLRGVAVLGILIMNIQSFSMPNAAYINPDAYGDLAGINKWVWILSHILASEKFMSIFSLLFGAGVLIFTGNALKKGKNCAALHYRRMGWLLLFGMMHAYMLWYGDILVTYSLCGMFVFLFRNKRPASLVWTGLGFFMVPIVLNALFGITASYWPEESYQSTLQSWSPDAVTIQNQIQIMTGGWLEQMELRIPSSIFMQSGYFMMEPFWQVTSMMLLGMALFKWRILSAERSRRYYTRMAAIGLTTGYALSGLGVFLDFRDGWSMEFSMFIGKQFNYIGSVGVALAYVAAVMLICKSTGFRNFRLLGASVGRMAFSNYILQTIICTFIFYGHGLALYGRIERTTQLLMVLGIWVIVILVSSLWLKRFRFGPLEWLWRSLTYWKWQSIL